MNMLIADARSLFEPQPTGVTEVARQFLEIIKELRPETIFLEPRAGRSNSLTNLALTTRATTIESLVSAPKNEAHTVFLPNIHFVNTRSNTKVVQLVHDISFLDSPWWYSPRVRAWHVAARAKQNLLRADILCAVSDFTAQRLQEELQIPAHKIFITPPFTPAPIEQKMPQLPFSPNTTYFLALGTREWRKNSAGILRAFEIFKKSASYCGEELLFVGRSGYGAPKNAQSITYCTPEEKWWLLKNARALLYPSFYEGFGLPPLEAGAVGTPSLIADVTAPKETMGAAALLVNPYDAREIALGIETLATNDKLHAELSARAFARAAEFSAAKTRASLQKVLEAVG